MSVTRRERASFWLVWLLGLAMVAGLLYFGTGSHEAEVLGRSVFGPIDSYARGQFGEPYVDASNAVGGLLDGLLKAGGSLASAFAGAAGSLAGAVTR